MADRKVIRLPPRTVTMPDINPSQFDAAMDLLEPLGPFFREVRHNKAACDRLRSMPRVCRLFRFSAELENVRQ